MCLKSVVIPWCNQVAVSSPCMWQQDSAPAHKSKETHPWLQKECYNFVPFSHRPPSSLGQNSLDYFVWSYVENITNMTSHNTKASLIASHPPSIRRAPTGAWGKGRAPSSGSVSRWCPWCSRYRRRKWTQGHEFKSWTRLIAFHIALIPLGKVWIQLFSLQLWVNRSTD